MSSPPAPRRPDPIRAALLRIPEVGPQILQYLGPDGRDLPAGQRAEAIARLAGAGLQREVEALRAEFAELRASAAVVAESERAWRPVFRARDRVVLANGVGRMVSIPVGVARLIASGQPVDVAVTNGADGVVLVHEGETVAEIPRSLLPQLDRVLAAVEWGSPSPPRPGHGGGTQPRQGGPR